MTITIKAAERIVSLHASVKSLRADIAALGDGRKIVEASIYVKTADPTNGWATENAKDFRVQNTEAGKLARDFIMKMKQKQLAACIRELNQLGAEIPA